MHGFAGWSESGRKCGWGSVLAATLLACAASSATAPLTPAVRPGLETLLSDSAHLVKGRRVGLVANNASVDHAGTGAVDRLLAGRVQLVALFSPEHGFRGAAAPGAAVASTTDSATGLPIYSLYGRTVAPTPEMLRDLDVLLVDLQDVGARYFTYISTTIEVMRAAGAAGIPVVILDRPNPIGGAVQGNVLDSSFTSFVGRLTVPMRHGLTLGELARLARRDLAINVDVRVVPVTGWKRSMPFDSTALPYVPPSPNLRTVEALEHYPGVCLFEGTNLSVGRGTDAPFTQIGAPWLDSDDVLKRLDRSARPGVIFEPVSFTPTNPGDGKFADTRVEGIRLHVRDRSSYDPTRTAIALLQAIRSAHPTEFAWIGPHFDRLAGQRGLRAGIDQGMALDELTKDWAPQRARFRQRVADVLIYGPLPPD